MKTKLLKKLHKIAHDSYRISPTYRKDYRKDEWVIEWWDGKLWRRTQEYFTNLDIAINRLEGKRRAEFIGLAERLISEREFQRRLEQVKDL